MASWHRPAEHDDVAVMMVGWVARVARGAFARRLLAKKRRAAARGARGTHAAMLLLYRHAPGRYQFANCLYYSLNLSLSEATLHVPLPVDPLVAGCTSCVAGQHQKWEPFSLASSLLMPPMPSLPRLLPLDPLVAQETCMEPHFMPTSTTIGVRMV